VLLGDHLFVIVIGPGFINGFPEKVLLESVIRVDKKWVARLWFFFLLALLIFFLSNAISTEKRLDQFCPFLYFSKIIRPSLKILVGRQ
jgi:hypothetical protein